MPIFESPNIRVKLTAFAGIEKSNNATLTAFYQIVRDRWTALLKQDGDIKIIGQADNGR